MRNIFASLSFRPDGSAFGLYTEAIDLRSIGKLNVKRASRIEFDNANQVWCVSDLQGRRLFSSPSRGECLHWEITHLIEDAETS